MCGLMRVLAAVVALAMSTGSAFAAMAKTETDVALRSAPAAQAGLILNLSQGTLVNVDGCSRGWCGVTWNRYVGYVRQNALRFLGTPASGPPAIPVFPPYPYKAGHYPTADAYYDLPPYAAINPSFYRWRHFLTAQERNRYRYMPYIFHGAPSVYREQPTFKSAEATAPAIEPFSPESQPKMEPSPATPAPSPQAPPPAVAPAPTPPPAAAPPGSETPEVSPPSAAPAPSPQAPPPAVAPAPSPQAPEVPPPAAAPAPSPEAPEVSPPSGESQQPTVGTTVTELRDVTDGWSVKRSILGQPVYNEKDERVGSVDDIIISRDKAVSYAIVNAGGFLGLTKHNVALPVSQFKLVDDKFVLPGVTKDALKARPELSDVTNGWSVKRSILGQPVYNEKDERVGSVDDIIVTRDKAVSYAIINAGGFLGLTKHNVAIPVYQFKLVDQKLVLPGATKDALKAMPEFQYSQ
jgi:uncharacterized protein YrrD